MECGNRTLVSGDGGSGSIDDYRAGGGGRAGLSPIVFVKATLLVFLLVTLVAANVVLVLRVTRRGRKWTACERLAKTLAVLGLLNGLLNVFTYLLTTCLGGWLFGGTLCQFHGVFGTVIINSWTWILAIASFERFVKLLVPSEHASLFSEVNTKIMTWGTILLLFVMYLGPVYGWGEYSFFRGKIDLTVGYKLNVSDGASPSHEQAAVRYLQSLGSGNNDPLLGNTMVNVTRFFEKDRRLYLRRPEARDAGIILPLRAYSSEALQCLWSDFKAGLLAEQLQDVILSNSTLSQLGVPMFNISLSIREEQYSLYTEVHLPYQESSTCSLDYSNVNEHVYSFVGFTSLCNILLPMAVMLYCYGRLSYAGVQKLCMFSQDGLTPEDAMWTRVFGYTGIISMACHLPFTVANLMSGRGVYVPASAHYALTLLVFGSTCLLAVFYFWATRSYVSDYGEPTGRFCCLNLPQRNINMFNDIHQRLLSRPGSSSNSPYKMSTRMAASLATTPGVTETEL